MQWLLIVLLSVESSPAPAVAGWDEASFMQELNQAKEQALHVASEIRVDITHVVVPVIVTGKDGRPVIELEAANFRILDDKEEQRVTTFAKQEVPLELGIVLDFSGSMVGNYALAHEALLKFIKTLEPRDRFFILRFGDAADILRHWAHPTPDVVKSLEEDSILKMGCTQFTARNKKPGDTSPGQTMDCAQGSSTTVLLDAVLLGIQYFQKTPPSSQLTRKALILVTDGVDNGSKTSFGSLKNEAKGTEIQIYAITVPPKLSRQEIAVDPVHQLTNQFQKYAQYEQGKAFLKDLSKDVGISGNPNRRVLAMEKIPQLEDRFREVVQDLRQQYTLVYPLPPRDPSPKLQWHSIKVELVPPVKEYKVYHKNGYQSN